MHTLAIYMRPTEYVTEEGPTTYLPTAVEEGEKKYQPFHGYRFSSIPKLSVEIVFLNPERRVPAALPPNLLKRLASALYLYHGKKDHSFNCYAFARFLHDLPPHSLRHFPQFWDVEPLPDRANVGDIVFLMKKDAERYHLRHAALHVGQDVYLSVYGDGANLIASMFEDLKLTYACTDFDTVLLAKPRLQARTA